MMRIREMHCEAMMERSWAERMLDREGEASVKVGEVRRHL